MGVTGVILAGGKASRYGGRPKGLEPVGGIRIVDRVVRSLEAVTDDLLVIANDPSAGAWLPGIRVAADVIPDQGGLGGLHAALVHARQPVVVVAWDMPFVPPSLLRALLALGSDADAVLPESDSHRGVEPLCAFYSVACLDPIAHALARHDRRVIAFHDDVRTLRYGIAEVRRHGDPARIFMNVNTPDELADANAHAATTDPLDRRP